MSDCSFHRPATVNKIIRWENCIRFNGNYKIKNSKSQNNKDRNKNPVGFSIVNYNSDLKMWEKE